MTALGNVSEAHRMGAAGVGYRHGFGSASVSEDDRNDVSTMWEMAERQVNLAP